MRSNTEMPYASPELMSGMQLRMPVQYYAVCNSSFREWLSLVRYTLYTLEVVTDKVLEMSLIYYYG